MGDDRGPVYRAERRREKHCRCGKSELSPAEPFRQHPIAHRLWLVVAPRLSKDTLLNIVIRLYLALRHTPGPAGGGGNPELNNVARRLLDTLALIVPT